MQVKGPYNKKFPKQKQAHAGSVLPTLRARTQQGAKRVVGTYRPLTSAKDFRGSGVDDTNLS